MSGESRHPSIEDVASEPAWARLEVQLHWYERAWGWNRAWYRVLKLVQIALAVAIPVVVLVEPSWIRWLVVGLGVGVVVLEAIQQLFQFNTLWIEYRCVATQLGRERALFLAGGGPYRGLEVAEGLAVLAERVAEIAVGPGATSPAGTRPSGSS